jgi:hypothetical protein
MVERVSFSFGRSSRRVIPHQRDLSNPTVHTRALHHRLASHQLRPNLAKRDTLVTCLRPCTVIVTISSNKHSDKPTGLGRWGARVAKTPNLVGALGGLIFWPVNIDLDPWLLALPRGFKWNEKMIHKWEYVMRLSTICSEYEGWSISCTGASWQKREEWDLLVVVYRDCCWWIDSFLRSRGQNRNSSNRGYEDWLAAALPNDDSN